MGDGQTSRRWKEVIKPTFRRQCADEQLPCWLCQQPIDYSITDIHDDDVFEPDHFFPRSTHPQYAEDPANLLPSHRGCNRARGNGDPPRALAPTSRQWF